MTKRFPGGWRGATAVVCAAAAALLSASPLATGLGTAAGLVSFEPASVTFVSAAHGFVLGSERCSGDHSCLTLLETTDGGRSWLPRRLPAQLVAAAARSAAAAGAEPGVAGLQVRFADPRDGWIYGGLLVPGSHDQGSSLVPALWSTHDGGGVWRVARPAWVGSGGTIFDLEAGAGTAYLLAADVAGHVDVASTAVSRDRWRIRSSPALGNPAGGGQQSGALVLQGRSGWLVEGNDRGTTGSARVDAARRWVSWTPPCASVGHSFAVPAAADARWLAAVCIMGGFAYPLSSAAPPGATLGSSWLYVSDDGGASFAAAREISRNGELFDGELASPAPGVVLLGAGSGAAQHLIASFDGGAHWSVVYDGELTYLGFTTPAQGVGIVLTGSGATRLIMSFDGGHVWKPVAL